MSRTSVMRHPYLGTARLHDWDFAGAEREFLRAIEPDQLMVFLNLMESLDPLRDDPRFRAIGARLGRPS